jgi:hypothetical protein
MAMKCQETIQRQHLSHHSHKVEDQDRAMKITLILMAQKTKVMTAILISKIKTLERIHQAILIQETEMNTTNQNVRMVAQKIMNILLQELLVKMRLQKVKGDRLIPMIEIAGIKM